MERNRSGSAESKTTSLTSLQQQEVLLGQQESQEENILIQKDAKSLSWYNKMLTTAALAGLLTLGSPTFGQNKTSDINKSTTKIENTINGPEDPRYTEKVTMPDGTIFMVSKEELVKLNEYREGIEIGLYADEKEMLVDYKKSMLQDRELAKKEENIAKKEENIAKKEENIAKKEENIANLDKKIKERKENAKKERTQILKREITEQEAQQLTKEFLGWRDDYQQDEKLVTDIAKQSTHLTDTQIQTLKNIQSKYAKTNSEIPNIVQLNAILVNTIKDMLTTHNKVAQN